ncbi:MAG TPA: helix-turn-helix domain-containing protein [Saprospiraceae bacterium]|nr:helix-turn-helix domain-containing protein [Saprospiraceae bacterium]
MEQVFFNVPLSKLEPIFKRWIKEAQAEMQPTKVEPTDQPEQLLNIDEVANLLHLTKPTIYSKHSKGEIPGVCKQGKRLYFQRDVIINWIKSGRKKSNAEIEAEAESYLSKNKKGLNNGK